MTLLTFMTFTLFSRACALTKFKHPDMDQLAKMASVCRLCWSSVAYSQSSIVW